MYKYLDHEADVGILSEGESLEQLFSESALAMYNLMTNISKIGDNKTIDFDIDSDSIENLLVKFLNELLFYTGSMNIFFSKFDIEIDRGHLHCRAYGENIDFDRHEIKTEVKAVTYSGIKYWKKGNKHFFRFVVDV